MLHNKREQRRYKFNNSEYKISRRMMIIRVSKILSQRISFFMKRLLIEGKEGHMEEIRESSLLFKERHYGRQTWDVQVPMSGFANVMPLFYSFSVEDGD